MVENVLHLAIFLLKVSESKEVQNLIVSGGSSIYSRDINILIVRLSHLYSQLPRSLHLNDAELLAGPLHTGPVPIAC